MQNLLTVEELLGYFNQPFKFWRCLDHPKGHVIWEGSVATCQECSKTNV